MAKQSEINLKITLDENHVPETITWSATDGNVENKPSLALFLSLWDAEAKHTSKIDLWTKDMMVDDMKLFFYQNLMMMADTLERSTNETPMALTLKDFADYFAEKMDLKTPNTPQS
jgi:gliding motility-associated protein GldC